MVPTTATDLYPVRSYEVDVEGRLTPAALCNYLQESAGLHARRLGVSVEQLQALGMTWFLWRLHLQVARLPTWTEIVEVETWPAEMGRPYAVRDFRLRVGEDPIGVATSAWLLMDLATKRPIRRVPDRIRDLHPDPPKRALSDAFRRLPACGTSSAHVDLKVRRSDLDLNGHLNHVAAISALLEAVPADLRKSRQIAALEVEYRGEGHLGDRLTARSEPIEAGDLLQHSLTEGADRELARARTRWRQPGPPAGSSGQLT